MTNQVAKKQAPKLEKDVSTELAKLATVSARIRYLDKEGMSRADIARTLNKRYQHVKNVLDRPLKTNE